MKKRVLLSGLILAFTASVGFTQQVNINAGGAATAHAVAGGYQKVRLLVTGPDGLLSEQYLNGASANAFQIDTRGLADGRYHYRLDFSVLGAAVAADTRLPVGADGRALSVKPGLPAPSATSGTFMIQGGQVSFPKVPSHGGKQDVPGKSATPIAKDQVIPDDLIVQGNACVGFDCINNESFGFDTLRLKENSTRIKFEDTSAAGFPTVDWQLTANDSAAGGAEKFSIEDITNAKVPFTISGNAATDSVFVDATGRVGFRTSAPVLDLHLATSNTPAQRLEQTGAGGFTAQTWDIAGNEANFFIRDVTSGSRLPFRIRPGAPTSSIDIAASGNVGIGTASPTTRLDVAGDVSVRGTISQLSSRTAKEDFVAIDGQALLQKIDALPITTWRYIAASDRHLGPVAEDFHQAFGLGATDKMIAPADMAGVALAAVKALQDQVQQRDRQIEALERRLSEIEAQSRR